MRKSPDAKRTGVADATLLRAAPTWPGNRVSPGRGAPLGDIAASGSVLSALRGDQIRGWAQLLEGGDSRVRGAYGLPDLAAQQLVHLGSCTANPITPKVIQDHLRIESQRLKADPRETLRAHFGAQSCVLSASGTDAEYVCAQAMGGQPYLCILVDTREVGSGCRLAAAGLPHVPSCPIDAPLNLQVRIECVALRDAHGCPLPEPDIDEHCRTLAGAHPELPLLLHHLPCSKTGLSGPSEALCLELQSDHPQPVRVVVDASQGRCSREDVQRWLGLGWAVILTGSKFLGAPPFCGAVLFSQGWPQVADVGACEGLLRRWRLALEVLDHGLDAPVWESTVQTHFVARLPGLRCDTPSGLTRQGILSFDLGLDPDRSKAMHRALIARGYFIGQPVMARPGTLLRIAPSVHTAMADAAQGLQGLATTIQDLLRHA